MNGVDFLSGAFGRGIDKITNIVGKWGSSQPVDDSKSGIKIGDKIYQVVVSLNGCYWYLDEEGKKHPVSGIPATTEWEWINIAEKVIKDFKTCYRTPGGKVEVWSWYLLNDQMDVLKETHRITDSTDMDNPVGKVLTKIPDEWVMIDCDLPDMTERDVTYVLECYTTKKGKVQVEGLVAIDNILGAREEVYTVLQSTDPDIKVGTVLDSIPEDWVRMVCDFPDMTDREIVEVDECYKTDGGKVNIKGYQAIDAVLGVREQYYYIVKTTDDAYPQWTRIDKIPNEWTKTECDFPDLTERHIMSVDECYTTPGGKIHLGGYRSVDSIIGVRDEYLIVLETTDPDIQRGATFSKIQEGWQRIVCDFPDATTSDTEIVENCYKTEKGKVQIRTYITMDGYGNTRELRHMVLKTTDPDYNIGSNINQIPVGWLSIECDFASATQRHIRQVKNCYVSDAGSIYVEGEIVYDNDLDVDKMALTVMESTDPAIAVGAELAAIPSGYVRTVCRCNCCNH